VKIVNASAGQSSTTCMSAVSLGEMDSLAGAVDDFSQALLRSRTSLAVLQKAVDGSMTFSGTDYGYKDLGDLCASVMSNPSVTDVALKEAAARVLDRLGGAVIAEQHIPEFRSHGLTIEQPETYGVPKEYGELDFNTRTHWKQAMDKLSSLGARG